MKSLARAAGAVLNAADSVKKAIDESETVNNYRSKQQTHEKPFPYDPLPTSSSIRLIKLEPVHSKAKARDPQGTGDNPRNYAGSDDDDIRFTMRTVELDQRPIYTALSYTWRRQHSMLGVASRFIGGRVLKRLKGQVVLDEIPDTDAELKASKLVTCNGAKMKIFANLFDALKQLRRSRSGEWLWIDVVCMNQRDDVELASQICVKGQIFKSAQLVIVWLGTWSSFSIGNAQGLAGLEELAKSGKPLPPNPLYNWILKLADVTPTITIDDFDNPEVKDELEAVAQTALHLANRSYFKRVWVVQELCLARKAIYLYGAHEISPEALRTACDWYLDSSVSDDAESWLVGSMRAKYVPYIGAHMQFLPATLQAREAFFSKGSMWTLLQWFQACNGRRASVVKDYVFAGLSLVSKDLLVIDQGLQPIVDPPSLPPRKYHRGPDSDTQGKGYDLRLSAAVNITPQGLWSVIAPDYTVSESEVLVNAAACLMSHSTVEELLRLSSRLRDKYQFRGSKSYRPPDEGPTDVLPSWVPALGSWTSRLLISLVPAGAINPFSAGTANPILSGERGDIPAINVGPSISPNGRVLSINAAVIDSIACSYELAQEEFSYKRKVSPYLTRLGTGQSMTSSAQSYHRTLLQLIRLVMDLPLEYDAAAAHHHGKGKHQEQAFDRAPAHTTKYSLLEALSYTMVAGHVNGKHVGTPAETGTWLCEAIESHIRRVAQEADKVDGVAASPRGSLEVDPMTELEVLKAKYAHLVWPGKRVEPINVKDDVKLVVGQTKEDRDKERESLEDNSKTRNRGIKTMLSHSKSRAEDKIEDLILSLPLKALSKENRTRRPITQGCRAFEEAFIAMLTWRRIFFTSRGLVGLGPRWMEEGDRIMLIPGSSVSFVFAREVDDLTREAERIQHRLALLGTDKDEGKSWAAVQPEMEARLKHVVARLQQVKEEKSNRWVLVGDAFIEGMMHGELMGEAEFGRIEIA